ncbi:MAG TPA: sugar phosphate nucleotidyltransferase, partial [Calditrichia bacterium]|nr:sugar phosphate nucleotidyltransferase [Calditrichia bacterium]
AYRENALVTLGITPNEPATGYGYIQAGPGGIQVGAHRVHRVKTFAEKPNLDTATRFLQSGDFYWNSGMFIWKASTILREIGERLPELHEQLMSLKKHIGKPQYGEKLQEVYRDIEGVSIDVGVMQQAENVHVIPVDMGWNDVGSWETVYDISEKDRHGHAGQTGSLVNIGSRNCYVYSPEKVVALVGVKDLIVVDTGDALLICRQSEAQSVKDAVDYLTKKGNDRHL